MTTSTVDLTTEDMAAFAVAVYTVLKETRKQKKLTQIEVANRTGGLVSKAAYANYETGHRSLRVDVVWVLCLALEVSIESVMQKAAARVAGNRSGRASGSPLVVPGWFASHTGNGLVSRINAAISVTGGIPQRTDGARVLNADQAAALARLLGMSLAKLRQSVRVATLR